MGWTKGQFVEQAFVEIGLAPYFYDLAPEQLNVALVRLDAMIARWNGQGIMLGYPLSNPTSSTLDTPTDVPDSATQAIICNLALIISPLFGKTPNLETKNSANQGYKTLLSRAAMPNEMQLPSMPMGAGNIPYSIDRPFRESPANSITVNETLNTGIDL